MVKEDSQSELRKPEPASYKETNLRMITNVSRMANYNREYSVHVHTDESLLELQVGIYHHSPGCKVQQNHRLKDGQKAQCTFVYNNKFVKLNWLAEREHFRKSTSSNQTKLNHTKPNSFIPN